MATFNGRDPSRTTLLRKQFIRGMNKRFRQLNKEIKKLVDTDDVFGLRKQESNFTFNIEPQAWRFLTDSEKLTSFNRWFAKQVQIDVLQVTVTGQPWTSEFVESAYKKGVIRGFEQVHAAELAESLDFFEGTKQQFLNQAFGAPETVSKLRLIGTRVFEELKGVTNAMSQQMSRILARGLADGKGPAAIAREMTNTITKLNRTRARVIARTEIIHAHAEGQLDSFERLGIEEVNAEVEWSTAGDDRVCTRCENMEGETFTVKEARGLIPLHPNCRCAWIPAFGPKKKKKKRSKAK